MLNFRFLYVWLDSKCYLVHNHSRKYRGLDLSPQTQLRCFDFSSMISNLCCHKQGWKFVSRSLRNFQRCHNCWNTLVHCHKISSGVTFTDIETQSQTVVSGSGNVLAKLQHHNQVVNKYCELDTTSFVDMSGWCVAYDTLNVIESVVCKNINFQFVFSCRLFTIYSRGVPTYRLYDIS